MWTEHYRPRPAQIPPSPAAITSSIPAAGKVIVPSRQGHRAVVPAVGQFIAAHPVRSQVFVLLLGFLLTSATAVLGIAFWIVGGITVAIWRHSLTSASDSTPRKRVASKRAATHLDSRNGPTRREAATKLTQAVGRLKPATLTAPLIEQIEVAGEIHHIKDIRRVYAAAGKTITASGSTLNNARAMLCPEPWNAADSNAVAVMVGIYHVGYLPWDIAVDYATPLLRLAKEGQGVMCEVRIWAKLEDGAVRARVTLLAPEADALS